MFLSILNNPEYHCIKYLEIRTMKIMNKDKGVKLKKFN